MIKGIDISHQNSINWENLSSDMEFVWHKATQGATFKDPAFNSRWQYLKSIENKVKRGAYMFVVVGVSAQAHVDNFISLGIDFSNPNVMPPMIDVEDQVPASDNVNITNDKAGFIQLVTDIIVLLKTATGRNPIIYSYKNFFNEYLNNHSWPEQPLWLASYQSNPPGLPVGYDVWSFWQYSEVGTIEGASTGGDIDLDYFNGTIQQLSLL